MFTQCGSRDIIPYGLRIIRIITCKHLYFCVKWRNQIELYVYRLRANSNLIPERNILKFYDAAYVKEADGIPECTCGGRIKPDVVLYEEGLDSDVIQKSIQAISRADTLIIGGTSLVVYPDRKSTRLNSSHS